MAPRVLNKMMMTFQSPWVVEVASNRDKIKKKLDELERKDITGKVNSLSH